MTNVKMCNVYSLFKNQLVMAYRFPSRGFNSLFIVFVKYFQTKDSVHYQIDAAGILYRCKEDQGEALKNGLGFFLPDFVMGNKGGNKKEIYRGEESSS